MDDGFRRELLRLGIFSYHEQETLWKLAKRCAGTVGVPMAGAGFVMSRSVAGALAGLLTGTLTCTMLNSAVADELRKLARGRVK